jgi:RecA-family ATPase
MDQCSHAGLSGGSPAKPTASRFKLYTTAELASLPRPEWLLPDLIAAGSLCVLYGAPEAGKSFLAMDLALSIATGTPGIAEPRATGPVVYIAGEGSSGLYNRLQAWEQKHAASASDIYFVLEPVNMRDPNAVNNLIAAVRQLAPNPKLIVIDTMARCMFDGDENSAKDVGGFIVS